MWMSKLFFYSLRGSRMSSIQSPLILTVPTQCRYLYRILYNLMFHVSHNIHRSLFSIAHTSIGLSCALSLTCDWCGWSLVPCSKHCLFCSHASYKSCLCGFGVANVRTMRHTPLLIRLLFSHSRDCVSRNSIPPWISLSPRYNKYSITLGCPFVVKTKLFTHMNVFYKRICFVLDRTKKYSRFSSNAQYLNFWQWQHMHSVKWERLIAYCGLRTNRAEKKLYMSNEFQMRLQSVSFRCSSRLHKSASHVDGLQKRQRVQAFAVHSTRET